MVDLYIWERKQNKKKHSESMKIEEIQTCGRLVLPGPEDFMEALRDGLSCGLLSKTVMASLMDFGLNSFLG